MLKAHVLISGESLTRESYNDITIIFNLKYLKIIM